MTVAAKKHVRNLNPQKPRAENHPFDLLLRCCFLVYFSTSPTLKGDLGVNTWGSGQYASNDKLLIHNLIVDPITPGLEYGIEVQIKRITTIRWCYSASATFSDVDCFTNHLFEHFWKHCFFSQTQSQITVHKGFHC